MSSSGFPLNNNNFKYNIFAMKTFGDSILPKSKFPYRFALLKVKTNTYSTMLYLIYVFLEK